MQNLLRLTPAFLAQALALVLVAGCSMGPSNDVAAGPTLNQPNPALAQQPAITPASLPTTTVAATAEVAMTDVTAFLEASVIGKLSIKEKSEASSAQFNALTFGRPGAPRSWAGDKGATGQVTVGPYVRVNNIDCRDFTHTVTIAGAPYAKKGTACREADGTWNVAG